MLRRSPEEERQTEANVSELLDSESAPLVVAPSTPSTRKYVLAITILTILCLALIITLIVSSATAERSDIRGASCEFVKLTDTGPFIQGTITFRLDPGAGTHIKYELTLQDPTNELPAGTTDIELRLHEFGGQTSVKGGTYNDLILPNELGRIYNPGGRPGSCSDQTADRRVGDFDRLKMPKNQPHSPAPHNDRLMMLTGPWSVLGRSIVAYRTTKCGNPEPTAKALGYCNIVARTPSDIV